MKAFSYLKDRLFPSGRAADQPTKLDARTVEALSLELGAIPAGAHLGADSQGLAQFLPASWASIDFTNVPPSCAESQDEIEWPNTTLAEQSAYGAAYAQAIDLSRRHREAESAEHVGFGYHDEDGDHYEDPESVTPEQQSARSRRAAYLYEEFMLVLHRNPSLATEEQFKSDYFSMSNPEVIQSIANAERRERGRAFAGRDHMESALQLLDESRLAEQRTGDPTPELESNFYRTEYGLEPTPWERPPAEERSSVAFDLPPF